jgi:hypothetical protein
VIKPAEGKNFEVWGLEKGTTSGEKGVTKLPPSNPTLRGENSTRTLPKFKLIEPPTDGVIGK